MHDSDKNTKPLPSPKVARPDEATPLSLLGNTPLGVVKQQRADGASVALRILRQVFGRRMPLLLPVSENARAAGTAAIIEMRSSLSVTGAGDERRRTALEVCDEVLNAAAPFVQRDLVNRILADRMWMSTVVVVSTVVALAGMGSVAVWALVTGSSWVAVVLGMTAAVVATCSWQISSAVRHQVQRARSVVDAPLTGQREDASSQTIDLGSAGGDGGKS